MNYQMAYVYIAILINILPATCICHSTRDVRTLTLMPKLSNFLRQRPLSKLYKVENEGKFEVKSCTKKAPFKIFQKTVKICGQRTLRIYRTVNNKCK